MDAIKMKVQGNSLEIESLMKAYMPNFLSNKINKNFLKYKNS